MKNTRIVSGFFVVFISLVFSFGALAGQTVQLPGADYKPLPVRGAAFTLLSDGRLLVTGGRDEDGAATRFAAIYDPVRPALDGRADDYGRHLATMHLNTARAYHSTLLLNDGRVLICGGRDIDEKITGSCEIFEPALGTIRSLTPLNHPRAKHGMVELSDGRVLFVGGKGDNGKVRDIEVMDIAANEVKDIGGLNILRISPVLSLLPNGDVLVASGGAATLEIFDAKSGSSAKGAVLPDEFAKVFSFHDPEGRVVLEQNSGEFETVVSSDGMKRCTPRAPAAADLPFGFVAGGLRFVFSPLSGRIVAISAAEGYGEVDIDNDIASAAAVLKAGANPGLVVKWLEASLSRVVDDKSSVEKVLAALVGFAGDGYIREEGIHEAQAAMLTEMEAVLRPEQAEQRNQSEEAPPVMRDPVSMLGWVASLYKNGYLDESLAYRACLGPFRALVRLIEQLDADSDFPLAQLKSALALRTGKSVPESIISSLIQHLLVHLRTTMGSGKVLVAVGLKSLNTDELKLLRSEDLEPTPVLYSICLQGQELLMEEGSTIPISLEMRDIRGLPWTGEQPAFEIPTQLGTMNENREFTAVAVGAAPMKAVLNGVELVAWISVVESGVLPGSGDEGTFAGEYGVGEGSGEEMAGGEETYDEAGADGSGDTDESVDYAEYDGEADSTLIAEEGSGDEYGEEGSGDEYVEEGSGDEYAEEGSGDEYVEEGSGDEYVEEGSGDEYVEEGSGDEYVEEGSGDDYSEEGSGDEYAEEGSGDEYAEEGSGDEYAEEGSGDEYAEEGSGDEYAEEGSGDEYAEEGSGEEYAEEGSGDEYAEEGSGDEYAEEGSGDEYAEEGSGDEYAEEGSGEEYTEEGSGDDYSEEGSGDESSESGTTRSASAGDDDDDTGAVSGFVKPSASSGLKVGGLVPAVPTAAISLVHFVKPGDPVILVRALSRALALKDFNKLKLIFDPDAWEYYGPLYRKNPKVMPVLSRAVASLKPAKSVPLRAEEGSTLEMLGSALVKGKRIRVKVFFVLDAKGNWRVLTI